MGVVQFGQLGPGTGGGLVVASAAMSVAVSRESGDM
jgi:hypothetical protein